jgi:hypothetical protein
MSLLQDYNSPPQDDAYYREQWLSYYADRHRGVVRLLLAATGFGAFVLLLALVPEPFLLKHHWTSKIAAVVGGCLWLAYAVYLFSLNWKMVSWACPRCGEPFFVSTFVRNPFSTRCRHCKLRRPKRAELQA